MAYYLVQVTYAPEAWAAMVKNPQDRMKNAVQPVAEKLGGKVIGCWLAFGEYDAIAVLDLPNNVSAAAFSFVASAGGAIKSIKTTPLMTFEEGMQAMSKAGKTGYDAPQGGPGGQRHP